MPDEREDLFLARLWEAYTALLQREQSKVPQRKLAERIAADSGCPTRQDDVSRWLRGIGRPSYEELPAVGRALGVRHYWLAFNEGPMQEPSNNGRKAPLAHDRIAKGEEAKEIRRKRA